MDDTIREALIFVAIFAVAALLIAYLLGLSQ